MLRAVIFDFDGVIADSEMLHFSAFNQVLRQFGVELKKEDYFKNYLGLTDIDFFGDVADKLQIDNKTYQVEKLMQQKNQIFKALAKKQCRIMEAVPQLLSMLKQHNIAMAICSGAILADIELILTSAGLQRFFDVIVSADDVDRGKPEPDGFLLALARLHQSRPNPVLAKDCIVIEDSHWGIEAAQAAGMHTIAVTNSYSAEQLGTADRIVTGLVELTIDDLEQLCG